MKNNKFSVLGMLAMVLALGLVFTGCDTGTGSEDSGVGGNSFVGKWRVGSDATITIEFKTDLTWTWKEDGKPQIDSNGTYTANGNSAELTFTTGNSAIEVITNGRTITINNNSFVLSLLSGTGTFTKVNN
jgi:hypothetical protein